MASEQYCLHLAENPIRFEPVSSTTLVFFDESNEQLIIARSNGAGGVVAKSSRNKNIINFRLEEKGVLRSMNFSPNSRTLAIHRRTSKSVDFISVVPGWDTKEFSQQCKVKGANILGVFWPSDLEIVFVTDKSIEHYQIIPEKKSLKLLKYMNHEIKWYLWNAEGSTCVISSAQQPSTLHALTFKDGSFTRLPKFEINLPGQSASLEQRDVLLLRLYEQTFACHIISHSKQQPVELHLYLIKKDVLVRKTDVLLLNNVGLVVVNVVDNLVVVHQQNTKISFIFDILLDEVETVGGAKYHNPLIPPLPICPFKLPLEGFQTGGAADVLDCELYSSNWAVFGPNTILDAKLGCYWNIKLDNEALVKIVSDKCHLISILMGRQGSKSLILKECHDLIVVSCRKIVPSMDLGAISKIFDQFNKKPLAGAHHHHHHHHHQLIEQADIYQHVFSKLEENQEVDDGFLNAVIVEYVLSLSNHQIVTQTFISELFVNRLIVQGEFHELHQMLQYHVIEDSKPIAFKLLSVEDKFPGAYQLAVDMLKRLATSNESILEIFLSKNLLLTAIRFAHACGLTNQLLAQRLLDVAMTSGDDLLFFSVYNYFRSKNLRQRGNSKFYPGEGCDPYTEYYKSKFSSLASV